MVNDIAEHPPPEPVATPGAPALAVRGLSKTFPGTRALDRVDLDVAAGRVTALIGHNGCGKSTLIKVLAGFHEPDPGAQISVGGAQLDHPTADAAADAGMRFVHQDLGLVGELSVVDNLALALGYETGRLGRVRQRHEVRRCERAIGLLGGSFDVRRPVRQLAPSDRTVVAAARALVGWETGAVHVLVLDEPTAALAREEARRLFDVIRTVRKHGIAVLFVSHHLDEVLELADRVVVLRNGRVVTVADSAALDHDRLVSLVIGEEVGQVHAKPAIRRRRAGAPTALTVAGMGASFLRDVSFELARGEVLGVSGLTGSGREELAGCVFGHRPHSGRVLLGTDAIAPGGLDRAVGAGLALVPADRMVEALIPRMSVRENLSLPGLAGFARHGRLDAARERAEVDRWLQRTRVVRTSRDRPIFQLSGGNQQKVVLARWLRCTPKVLVLDEPTQGVDVGARRDIHDLIAAAADAGAAVLVCSTDAEELERLCDRVLVLARGRIVAELTDDELRADVIDRRCLDGGAAQT